MCLLLINFGYRSRIKSMSGIQFLTRIVSIRFLAPWPMGEGDRLTVHISQSILYTSMFISALLNRSRQRFAVHGPSQLDPQRVRTYSCIILALFHRCRKDDRVIHPSLPFILLRKKASMLFLSMLSSPAPDVHSSGRQSLVDAWSNQSKCMIFAGSPAYQTARRPFPHRSFSLKIQ